MHSINRAPFSSSCINISGDGDANRSAFDLLLATQKRGPLYPKQDPPSSPGTNVSTTPREMQDGRDGTSLQAWCGLESRAPFCTRSTHPRLLFLEMRGPGLLGVCSWKCFHRRCPRAHSRGRVVPAQTGRGCRTSKLRWPWFWLETLGTR